MTKKVPNIPRKLANTSDLFGTEESDSQKIAVIAHSVDTDGVHEPPLVETPADAKPQSTDGVDHPSEDRSSDEVGTPETILQDLKPGDQGAEHCVANHPQAHQGLDRGDSPGPVSLSASTAAEGGTPPARGDDVGRLADEADASAQSLGAHHAGRAEGCPDNNGSIDDIANQIQTSIAVILCRDGAANGYKLEPGTKTVITVTGSAAADNAAREEEQVALAEELGSSATIEPGNCRPEPNVKTQSANDADTGCSKPAVRRHGPKFRPSNMTARSAKALENAPASNDAPEIATSEFNIEDPCAVAAECPCGCRDDRLRVDSGSSDRVDVFALGYTLTGIPKKSGTSPHEARRGDSDRNLLHDYARPGSSEGPADIPTSPNEGRDQSSNPLLSAVAGASDEHIDSAAAAAADAAAVAEGYATTSFGIATSEETGRCVFHSHSVSPTEDALPRTVLSVSLAQSEMNLLRLEDRAEMSGQGHNGQSEPPSAQTDFVLDEFAKLPGMDFELVRTGFVLPKEY